MERDRLRRIVVDDYNFVWRSLRRLGVPESSAEDAAQQVFLIVSQKLRNVTPELERSYLFSVIVREAANVRRLCARRHEVLGDDADESELDPPNPETLLERKQWRAVLDGILARMSEERRTVFVLFEIEEFTLSEIAALLELPMGTVWSRLHRAREDFQSAIVRIRARNQERGGSP